MLVAAAYLLRSPFRFFPTGFGPPLLSSSDDRPLSNAFLRRGG